MTTINTFDIFSVENTKEAQLSLFASGYSWGWHSEVRNLDEPFLIVNPNTKLIGWSNTPIL